MLTLVIPAREVFDPETNLFYDLKEQKITLEHSLVSLSKWESKWETSFLNSKEMTREQVLDYIRCMTITPNVDPVVYQCLTNENINQIEEYIQKPMTATTFSQKETPGKREIITAELIYYWMIACQIPFECQKWHLNRLFTLIRVCSIKNQPKKKGSRSGQFGRYYNMNRARQKAQSATR